MPRRVEVSKDLCSRTFGSRFFFRFVFPEGVGKGSRTDPAGAPLSWEVHRPADRPPQKGGESSKEPFFVFFRRSRLAGFFASFVPGCFCRFFFGSGIASER